MNAQKEDIPDICPKCGGDVRLRPQIDGAAIGSGKKEWRCATGCVSWMAS
jgi:hypothetical protein